MGGVNEKSSTFSDEAVPLIPLVEHLRIIRELDVRFYEERDRRYSEVNIEREKALKIKETADLAALGLAREIQTYKDEKANELREQINNERNLYVTREQMASELKPLEETRSRGIGGREAMLAGVTVIAVIASVAFGVIAAIS